MLNLGQLKEGSEKPLGKEEIGSSLYFSGAFHSFSQRVSSFSGLRDSILEECEYYRVDSTGDFVYGRY